MFSFNNLHYLQILFIEISFKRVGGVNMITITILTTTIVPSLRMHCRIVSLRCGMATRDNNKSHSSFRPLSLDWRNYLLYRRNTIRPRQSCTSQCTARYRRRSRHCRASRLFRDRCTTNTIWRITSSDNRYLHARQRRILETKCAKKSCALDWGGRKAANIKRWLNRTFWFNTKLFN